MKCAKNETIVGEFVPLDLGQCCKVEKQSERWCRPTTVTQRKKLKQLRYNEPSPD